MVELIGYRHTDTVVILSIQHNNTKYKKGALPDAVVNIEIKLRNAAAQGETI